MYKVEKEVKIFMEFSMCDCGGELIENGLMLACDPPKFKHLCSACGKEEALHYKSPRQKYQIIEKDESCTK